MTALRIFSHTPANTEIVCALGRGDWLVGVDADSDHPSEVVARLPRAGRDLDLDAEAVLRLAPDLVLTSLTVPGHERVVERLQRAGLRILVSDPQSLAGVYANIAEIGEALQARDQAAALVARMEAAMPPVTVTGRRPAVLVEWWPKPVIAPARRSWTTDLIERAGGRNPWADADAKSLPLENARVIAAAPEIVVMSWCGVREDNYRAQVVRRREGWEAVPAVRHGHIHACSEAWLGRPGPRLVGGYRRLREYIAAATATSATH